MRQFPITNFLCQKNSLSSQILQFVFQALYIKTSICTNYFKAFIIIFVHTNDDISPKHVVKRGYIPAGLCNSKIIY